MKRIAVSAVVFTLALGASLHAGDKGGFKPLFNGKDLKGWKIQLKDGKGDPATAFVVKDGEIQVPGDPWGYFYTDKSYKNYIIRYSWTYPKDQPEKTTMNSGLLVHIQEPHKVWPKSVEPQGRYKDHGKIFFIGFGKDDKKSENFDEAAQKKALKPAHEWNTTEATVRGDGTVEVRINGILVNTGKSELTSGPIGFQAEGARIHFKNIEIKMLESTASKEPSKGKETPPSVDPKPLPKPKAEPLPKAVAPPQATTPQPEVEVGPTVRRGLLSGLRARLFGRR